MSATKSTETALRIKIRYLPYHELVIYCSDNHKFIVNKYECTIDQEQPNAAQG